MQGIERILCKYHMVKVKVQKTSGAVEAVLEDQHQSGTSHASTASKEDAEEQGSQVVETEYLGKEQKQPLLADKTTTSKKTQRKKWSFFSSKSSGKQEKSEEEKENEASTAQTANVTTTQSLQHSSVTVSNGVSVTVDGEESFFLGQSNKDNTSHNVNSRRSEEKLGISEPSSANDVYEKSKNLDCSLELTSAEERETKETNILRKNEEADFSRNDSTINSIRDSKRKIYVDSAFYADPEGKYPTVEEQIGYAREVAHSIFSPVNHDSRGYKMFMKMGQRARAHTTGATDEDISAALAELNLSPDEAEKFYQENPWARKKCENRPVEDKSLEVVPTQRISLPSSSLLFAPNLSTNMTAEQLNALSFEELEKVRLLHEMAARSKTSKPPPSQACFQFSEDIRSMKGKGARLFAERQAKAESWMIDDSTGKDVGSVQSAGSVNSNFTLLGLQEGGKVESGLGLQQSASNEPSSPTRSKVPPKTLPKALGLHAKGEQQEDKKSPSGGGEEDKTHIRNEEHLSSEPAANEELTSASSTVVPAHDTTPEPSASVKLRSDSTAVSVHCFTDQTSDRFSSVSQISTTGPTSNTESVPTFSAAKPLPHHPVLASTSSSMGSSADENPLLFSTSGGEHPVSDSGTLNTQSAYGTTVKEVHAQKTSSMQETSKRPEEDFLSHATKVPTDSPSTISADT